MNHKALYLGLLILEQVLAASKSSEEASQLERSLHG